MEFKLNQYIIPLSVNIPKGSNANMPVTPTMQEGLNHNRGPENLAENEIHLWLVNDKQITNQALLNSYVDLLNTDETKRHQRFVFAQHQHQFLVTRALVRTVLAQYCRLLGGEQSPENIEFSKNNFGKPSIRYTSASLPLHFNLSHTDGNIVLAVSRHEYLGVDVERQARPVDCLNLAQRFFSESESEELAGLADAELRQRFFDLWTLKESYIKAWGMGLHIPLSDFSFSFPSAAQIAIAFAPHREDDARQWQFWQFQNETANSKIALALKTSQNTQCQVICRECVPMQSVNDIELRLLRKS